MRKKELIQKIESLEKRIIELEHPIELENGQEVRIVKSEGNQLGIVIDTKMIYQTKEYNLYFTLGSYCPFDYRKYQVLSKGNKYWYTRNELEKV